MLIFLSAMTDDAAKPKIRYIYDTYHDDMLRFARYKLKKEDRKTAYYDAEDLVQEAFIKLTRYHERIDLAWEEKRMRAYLFAIISNLMSDMLQKERECDALEDYVDKPLHDDDFIESLLVKERVTEVAHALDKLSEIYKMTMMYRYFENREIRDIALFMGVSEHTVYMRISRGQRLLKEALKGGKKHD